MFADAYRNASVLGILHTRTFNCFSKINHLLQDEIRIPRIRQNSGCHPAEGERTLRLKNKAHENSKVLSPTMEALNLTPLQRRVAASFFEKPPGTIMVGKAKLVAPFDEHQFLLRSGFYQRMVEDNQEPAKHILDQFEIPSLYDPIFLHGWLIANNIIPLPPQDDKAFENIYCEYLLVDGYMPPRESQLPLNAAQETQQLRRTLQEFEKERQLLETAAEEKAERDLAEWIGTMHRKLQDYISECRAEGKVPEKNLIFSRSCQCKTLSDQLVKKLRANSFHVTKTFEGAAYCQVTWEPFPSRRCILM